MSALEITSVELAERMSRSKAWRRALVAAANGRCHYCNRPGVSAEIGPDDRVWHVDHKTPIARGGSDHDDNLVLACKRCNLTKSVQPYRQFRSFALAAYWVPDDWRVSEYDLDLLMSTYDDALAGTKFQHARDAEWRVNNEKFCLDFVDADGGREPFLAWDDRLLESYPKAEHLSQDALINLELVAAMHRHLPALIAEIRMLRAERKGDTEGWVAA